jgi:hypothetical protein
MLYVCQTMKMYMLILHIIHMKYVKIKRVIICDKMLHMTSLINDYLNYEINNALIYKKTYDMNFHIYMLKKSMSLKIILRF